MAVVLIEAVVGEADLEVVGVVDLEAVEVADLEAEVDLTDNKTMDHRNTLSP